MIIELIANGIAPLEPLADLQLKDIAEYIKHRSLLFGSHVPAGCIPEATDIAVSCYSLDDAVNCPHIIERALEYSAVVEAYFHEEAVLYSVNIFTTYPGGEPRPDIHDWHRDKDDKKQLALFFALTDIPREAAHLYQIGSHRDLNEKFDHDFEVSEQYGPPGTSWIENPYGYHMARQPKESPRTLAWVRFGVSDVPAGYCSDHNYPVKSRLYDRLDEKHRKICRLLIKPLTEK